MSKRYGAPPLTDRRNYEEQRLRSHRDDPGPPPAHRKLSSPRLAMPVHDHTLLPGANAATKAKRKARITLPKVFK